MAGLVCLLGMSLVYVLAVRTHLGQTIDTGAMSAADAMLGDGEWSRTVLDFISPASLLLVTVAIAAVGYASHGLRAAAKSVGAVVVIVGSAQLLKVTLTRPDLVDAMANSWPSGHVAAVAGLSVGATLAVPRVLRRTVALAGGVLVAVTSLATLAHQWHRPSDVIASALLAIAVAFFCGSLATPTRSSGESEERVSVGSSCL